MKGFSNESTYTKFVESGDEQRFDALFDGAAEKARREILGQTHPIYINGKQVYSSSQIEEHSPIDNSLVGTFQRGTREHAKAAIEAAHAAFQEWGKTDYRERIAIFSKAAELFRQQKFLVAAILSIENGKTRYESIGEVDEAIDFINYYSLDMERNKGYVTKNRIEGSNSKVSAGFQGAPGGGERISVVMKPYGVFGVIAPFNFPISISTGMSTGALITGNTIVFKPSSTDNMTMLTGLQIYKIFSAAGLPEGVFNYVTGPGSEVGDELVSSSRVSGIAFTGSRSTGMGMIAKTYGMGLQKAFIVEMGGKNPAIVSKNADIEAAVEGIVGSAFGYAGQKCSACSRVYVQESVKEEFVSRLAEKARSIKVGNPLIKENYLGPLISPSALERYKAAVEEARQRGRIIQGGKVVDNDLEGIYVEPTIVEADHSSRLFHEELFVPFLAIDSYKKFEEAIAKANDVEYGLTAGLYSRSRGEIKEFLDKIQAGVTYINRRVGATTGAIVGYHTFVGWKNSGLTGKGTGSRFYLQQFMREQSQAILK
jgi:1-pyrroline-5-carboxylate dehydrogenase